MRSNLRIPCKHEWTKTESNLGKNYLERRYCGEVSFK